MKVFFKNRFTACLLIALFLLPFIAKAQPLNDDVAGASLPAFVLPVNAGSSCSSTTNGTLQNATISTGIPAFTCATNPYLFDVWYSFTATSSNHTIKLDNYGGAYTKRQFAVYQTNTFGTLSTVTCSALSTSGSTALSVNFIDFSPGTTYLIRVMYPNTTNTGLAAATATFRLCVTTGTNNVTQSVITGKSYTNITRPNGGTIQNGDVLEFRQSINPGNWSTGTGSIYNVTFHDTIPAGLTYIPNSIKFKTNEGLTFESGITGSTTLTDASGDDEAVYNSGVMRVNVASLPRQGNSAAANRQYIYQGSPATTPITYLSLGGGKIHTRGRPAQFAQFVIIVVTYRVTVTAATGTTFTTSNGAFRYKLTTSDPNDITFPQTIAPLPKLTIYVSPNNTDVLCGDGSGVNVYSGGNFGSGNKRHDSTQLTIAPGYTWNPFNASSPGDGFFAVVNNTSSNSNYTNKYAPFPSAGGADTMRVFNLWDIIGDHTGASNVDSGNLAVPQGTVGGYMAVVNSAFGMNTAVQKNITGLCTDTYYEFSAWFKNICAGCSADSAGYTISNGALFKQYLPTKTLNDSSGVSPDLTYTIDGVDYYTTGPIIYDRRWIKKGFLFKTGPAQTSVTLTIRNNAAGGGGNDWAIDDISLATCSPRMSYSPSNNPTVCRLNPITIYDTVRSYSNNYSYYKWQRWAVATSGPWTDIAGASGTASPVFNPGSGMYEYVVSYTIPHTNANTANNGDKYRLVVATSSTNLSNVNCSVSETTTITLNVLNCGTPLATDLLSFSGKIVNDKATLNWTTTKEEEPITFTIEKSSNGNTFTPIGTVNSNNNYNATSNNYNFIDPTPITGKVWYRILLTTDGGKKKYSRIILLSTDNISAGFGNIINPFKDQLDFEFIAGMKTKADATLTDMYGKTIKKATFILQPGVNSLTLQNTGNLPAGMYILHVENEEMNISKKVVKK